ncbi:2-phospho-L-lactate guanylyltransferase [Leucobacter sp. Z1108]|uniref:2-phospho-L-lactate guanylyltransferase n=1 Tax=Leucobacter sp. Z1108 TaxID=3439066 RepID=UPI003F2F94C0
MTFSRVQPSPTKWSVVVPVRDFTTAKTRLRAQLPNGVVSDIAQQLAVRVVHALNACAAVEQVCVVSDVDLSETLSFGKARVMVQQPGGGLNGAVREGIARAFREAPINPVLVLHADLPRTTSSSLAALLARAEKVGRDSYLPDSSGSGTTSLVLFPRSGRQPAFGVDSARRHAELGFARLQFPRWNGLRNDLDTFEDLVAMQAGGRVPFWQAAEVSAKAVRDSVSHLSFASRARDELVMRAGVSLPRIFG